MKYLVASNAQLLASLADKVATVAALEDLDGRGHLLKANLQRFILLKYF